MKAGTLLIPIMGLVIFAAVTCLVDRTQLETDKILGDRIDLVNAKVDRECGR